MTSSDNIGDFTHDQEDMVVHMPFLEACAARAGVIVEIGVGHGNGSTRAFARGLERSTHYERFHFGVDIDPERPQIKPGYGYWREVHGASEDPYTRYAVQDMLDHRYASIIFIDTVHTKEQMQLELPIWATLAGPDTLWIFHDTWMFGSWNAMGDAIKEFAAAHDWEVVDYTRESHGLGLMRKAGGPWSDITPREVRT